MTNKHGRATDDDGRDDGTASVASPPDPDLAHRTVVDIDAWIRKELRGPRSAAVRNACDNVALAADFVRRVTEKPGVLLDAVRSDEAYCDALAALRANVRVVQGRLVSIDRLYPKEATDSVRTLARHATRLRASLLLAVAAFREVVHGIPLDENARTAAERLAEEFDNELVLRELTDVGEDATGRATAGNLLMSITAAARRIGQDGAERLGNAYDNYARREARTADFLRWFVIGLTFVIAGGAVWFNLRVTTATLALELARLSATIPLGLLTLYLARESRRHRRAASWASELAIALHTVDAYSAPLTEGEALRQALGMRVYGTPVDMAAPPDPDVLEELLNPVKKVTESVQGLSEAAQKLRDVVEKPRGVKPD